jgi:hypothetical protein
MPRNICLSETDNIKLLLQQRLTNFVVFWIPSMNWETTTVPETETKESDLGWIFARM